MATLNSFADLQKYSKQICGRKRFTRHRVKGIKANEIPFEDLPVDLRIKRIKQELGPVEASVTQYYMMFLGEWKEISEQDYVLAKQAGMLVKEDKIIKLLQR